ncbi:SAM-dependent methyltransferase, partial [Patescibacteria group bacterium]|nr:SAM-dependent methyltransferase [Patescibacteria group bacterium]MBU1870553.1 SAM-dependent methyltransferase [Patescibacteria group bacterium]
KNLFNINLSDANLIYCYLNLKTMDKLKEKFNKECKSGAIIISYQFPMHNINPQKIIQLDKDKVYFYKIA